MLQNLVEAGLPSRVVIATRESALALWQARHIEARLNELYPRLPVTLLGLTTEGDRKLGTSLAKIGGKGLFVKELEDAMLEGRADIAVHSLKDVPMNLPDAFALAAVTARADPRDALVSNRYTSLAALPLGACVGTSSLRRESQLRAKCAHLKIEPLRGNVQTRLRKLDEGQYDAIILAAAGLKRLDLEERIAAILTPEELLPAVGQGALGVECLASRADIVALLAPLNDAATLACVTAERALSRALAGSCNVPIAGFAETSGDEMRLRAYVGAPDGTQHVRGERTCSLRAERAGALHEAEALGIALAAELRSRGAAAILAALENT